MLLKLDSVALTWKQLQLLTPLEHLLEVFDKIIPFSSVCRDGEKLKDLLKPLPFLRAPPPLPLSAWKQLFPRQKGDQHYWPTPGNYNNFQKKDWIRPLDILNIKQMVIRSTLLSALQCTDNYSLNSLNWSKIEHKKNGDGKQFWPHKEKIFCKATTFQPLQGFFILDILNLDFYYLQIWLRI